jgi:hypothetical protein
MRFVFLIAILAAPIAARAEIIQLLDNTQVAGKILHFYDGIFQIETSGGQKIDLPTTKIKAITFKLPPARAEFSTPEKTFNRYKDAMLKGDLAKVVDCYALMFQGMLAQQLESGGADELKKMQREFDGMKFEIKGSKVTGQTAMLKVARTKGDDTQTTEIRLVLENGEWKMTP